MHDAALSNVQQRQEQTRWHMALCIDEVHRADVRWLHVCRAWSWLSGTRPSDEICRGHVRPPSPDTHSVRVSLRRGSTKEDISHNRPCDSIGLPMSRLLHIISSIGYLEDESRGRAETCCPNFALLDITIHETGRTRRLMMTTERPISIEQGDDASTTHSSSKSVMTKSPFIYIDPLPPIQIFAFAGKSVFRP